MDPKERYRMILNEKQKSIVEIGVGMTDKYPHYYFVCHICEDGIKSLQDESHIIVKTVEHMANEKHKILLMRFGQ